MTTAAEHADWMSTNERHLGAALTWLRAKLERLADPGEEESSEPRRRGRFSRSSSDRPALPSGDASERSEDAAATEDSDPPPALELLTRRLGLSRFERDVLLLGAAVELDTRVARLCAMAQDDPQRPWPTFALAMALFDDPHWDAMAPERPLRAWRLVDVQQHATEAFTATPLRADPRTVAYLKGLNHLDSRLLPLLTPLQPASSPPLPTSQEAVVARLLRRLEQSSAGRPLPVLELLGTDAASSRELAAHVSDRAELTLYRLPVDAMPRRLDDVDALARLWERESLLLPVALYLDALDADPAGDAGAAMTGFLERSAGLFFVAASEPWPGLPGDVATVDVRRPTRGEQARLWAHAITVAGLEVERSAIGASSDGADASAPDGSALDAGDADAPAAGARGDADTGDEPVASAEDAASVEHASADGASNGAPKPAGDPLPRRLAGQFDLDVAAIRAVVREARAGDPELPAQERLWHAALRQTRPRLERLAQRLEPRAGWDDLVLPRDNVDLLRRIAAQVRSRGTVYDLWGFRERLGRGLGITALFAGESGTGKTLAAEVLANDLALDLYRIDLSAVVSKYIGETEKNLRRLFDAAEQGGAILFFDEADALFGKRSEVKDSHDRYANIEISYLLQRMEGYEGLAILASNMKGALDTAFLRRLRFIVRFPFPGTEQRLAIWRRAFAADTPCGDLDLPSLAALNLTGGSIQLIAVNAAFLAAAEGVGVEMHHVLASARMEFAKLEKPVNEAQFRRAEATP